MKAYSLWQPWASFVAIGIKPFETRDYPPPASYIGQRIAIQAAKKPVNADDREWAAKHGITDIPLGAVVCTAVLRGAYQMPTDTENFGRYVRGSPRLAAIRYDEFGDYAPGRWVWWLTDIERLDPPVPARGMQGAWEWSEMPS